MVMFFVVILMSRAVVLLLMLLPLLRHFSWRYMYLWMMRMAHSMRCALWCMRDKSFGRIEQRSRARERVNLHRISLSRKSKTLIKFNIFALNFLSPLRSVCVCVSAVRFAVRLLPPGQIFNFFFHFFSFIFAIYEFRKEQSTRICNTYAMQFECWVRGYYLFRGVLSSSQIIAQRCAPDSTHNGNQVAVARVTTSSFPLCRVFWGWKRIRYAHSWGTCTHANTNVDGGRYIYYRIWRKNAQMDNHWFRTQHTMNSK